MVRSSQTQWTWNGANSRRLWKDREGWHAAVHAVAKNQTQLSNWTTATIILCPSLSPHRIPWCSHPVLWLWILPKWPTTKFISSPDLSPKFQTWMSIQPEYLKGISNLPLLKLNPSIPQTCSSHSHPYSGWWQPHLSHCSDQNSWNHPWFLSHMPHLIYQQFTLGWYSKHIQNSTIFHYILLPPW